MSDIKTTRPIEWTYTSGPHDGTCRLANDRCRITVEFQARTDTFHDVEAIDAWIKLKLQTPTTAEEFSIACHEKWKMPVRCPASQVWFAPPRNCRRRQAPIEPMEAARLTAP